MTDKDVEDLVAGATESEPSSEPDRHVMEEAVLATLARSGPAGQDLWQGFNRLAWSRPEMTAIAEAVWTCIKDTDGAPADPVLVRGRLEAAGASVPDAVLTPILDGSKAKDAAVARLYIKKLAGMDKRRRALVAFREGMAKVEEAGDVDAAVGGLLKTVCDLTREKGLVSEHATEAEELPDFLRDLADRRSSDRAFLGLDSGFRHLNEVFNGLMPGLYVLAGAPSTGKTTLAKQVADQVADAEKVPVLFFSYEQSKDELRIKSLSRLAQVDSRIVWKGRTDADTWAKVEAAAEDYRRGPGRWLTLIEAGRTDTVEAIRAAALMAKHKAGGKRALVVLDYLQIMPTPADIRMNGIKDKVDFNLSELRRLARDLDSPVLAVASENREAYKGNKRPTMYALKESGGTEYSADNILCLWRNKDETEQLTQAYGRKTVRVEVHVLKNRNGELANIKTDFTPAWSDLSEQGKEGLGYEAALGE
jgi:replicative DNA helicase